MNATTNAPSQLVCTEPDPLTDKPANNTPLLEKKALEIKIKELSKLSEIDYEYARIELIKSSGMRAVAIDALIKTARRKEGNSKAIEFEECEPWEDPVSLDELLTEIEKTIRRFIVCDKVVSITAALWIVFTWLIDYVHVAPLAIITAPEKGCGKSQLLHVMGRLVFRPLSTAHISPAALYRVIEAHQPTLLIDEADTFIKDNEDLRGIINSGHTRGSAYVIKSVGDDHTPTRFSTWGAKALSGIGKLPETIMDRSVILPMRKRLAHEKAERLRYVENHLFDSIRSKIQRCIDDNLAAISVIRPELPEELSDRAQDNWEPLLAIADQAGGDWCRLAREAALELSQATVNVSSVGNDLLRDIEEVFYARGVDKIRTLDLIAALCFDEEKAWATYNRGKPISPHQLSKRLSEYGITSKTIRFGSDTKKGYELDQFKDSFHRYLKNCNSISQIPVTTSQATTDMGLDVTYTQTHPVSPLDSVTINPKTDKDCDLVTNKLPIKGTVPWVQYLDEA